MPGKLLVCSRAVRLRREQPAWFAGGYEPMAASGPAPRPRRRVQPLRPVRHGGDPAARGAAPEGRLAGHDAAAAAPASGRTCSLARRTRAARYAGRPHRGAASRAAGRGAARRARDPVSGLGTGRHRRRSRPRRRALPMAGEPGGWWSVSAPAAADARYAFRLDGGDAARRSALGPAAGRPRRPEPALRPRRSSAGPTPAGRAGRCAAPSSTSCTSAPSPPRAPSTRPSSGSTTWSRSASTSSSSCPSRRSPAGTAGAMTASACGPCTSPTAGRTG